jgi:hypothetical protein
VNEKPSMIKENIGIVLFSIMIISFASIFLFSCQSSEGNKWIPPKFVKEWEIKEIKPGLATNIVSMVANKNGVYVLVKALEIKYSPPPKITKKAAEMTEKEKENFFNQFVVGRLFSASAVSSMLKEEKDEIINLVLDYFLPPKKAIDMTMKEKSQVIDFFLRNEEKREADLNKRLFRKWVQSEGKDRVIDSLMAKISEAASEEANHFIIQHYDFDGNFISQWPEENKLNLSDDIRDRIKPILIPRSFPYKETIRIDSRDYLIEPTKILSDDSGYIYLADYRGNKIVKFDSIGKSIGLWKVFVDRQIVESFPFHGVTITKKNHILLVGEGEYLITPKLCEYDSGGKLLRSEELKSKIKVYYELLKSLVPPFIRIERIVDMTAGDEGNIYLLRFRNIADEPSMIKLTPEWKEERTFEVILEKGFEPPRIKIYERFFKKFDSTQMSWIDTEPGYYFPSSLFTVGNRIYVTFLGSKPFGVIDAVIYDSKGKMVGYWKQEIRSHMDWFKRIGEDIEIVDTSLSLAQYNSSVFIGRTMKVRTGAFYTRSVIQRFQR